MNKTSINITPPSAQDEQHLSEMKTESAQGHTFHSFFDSWLVELHTNLEQLVSAAHRHHDDKHIQDNSSVLSPLIEKTMAHYEQYYKAKSESVARDVITMFSPTWLTKLEDSLLWIAGWRPTTAIHLLYSKSGIQLEARTIDLVPLMTVGDLGDLTSDQIGRIDVLQRETIRKERMISEKMARLQESAADTPMVNLSNEESETMRNGNEDGGGGRKVDSALQPKKDELEEVLHMADGLRMETLRSVVEILTPMQAVYFLIAAAELHLRLHDWGKTKDAI